MRSAEPSRGEVFLADFHAAHPGLTARVFGALPVVFRAQDFDSPYEVLATAVPRTAAPIHVLDLACGDGFLLSLLAARSQPGLALSGVDMSAAELKLARTRLSAAVVLCQARAQALPFAPESFDRVLSHLALMLMDDVEQVLRELHRMLKPGGMLAVVVGAVPPPSVAFSSCVEVLARHPPQEAFSGMRFGDRRFWHVDGIHELLSPTFRHVLVEEIQVSRRLTPEQLWDWLFGMYDIHLRGEADQRAIESEYLAALAPHCAADGRLDHLETLRYVSAKV